MFDPNLMIAPDVGGMIQQGIQQGQQTREQNMTKAATAALFKDPNNANALAALAQVNPEKAMEFRKQQLEYAKTQLGQHYDSVLKGGRIARQVQPKDQASWDQTLAMAQQAGVDISQVPRVWDENTAKYAQQLIGLADALKPETDPQDPGIIREYDEATKRGLVPPGTSYSQYVAMRNPGAQTPVILPNNIQQVGGGQAAPMTATDAHGNKVQYNPQSGQWEPMGGAGGNASGGFPDPYYTGQH